MNSVTTQDYESTEAFIRDCERRGATVIHERGNMWCVSTDKGDVHVKRSCNHIPREQRGILSFLAWGLFSCAVVVAVLAALSAPYWMPAVMGA